MLLSQGSNAGIAGAVRENASLTARFGPFAAIGGTARVPRLGKVELSLDIDILSNEFDFVSGQEVFRSGIEGSARIFGLGIAFEVLRRDVPIQNISDPKEASLLFAPFLGSRFPSRTRLVPLAGLEASPGLPFGEGGKIGLGIGGQAGFDLFGFARDLFE